MQVVFILLENVKKHSGISNSPIPVYVRVSSDNERLSIAIRSAISNSPSVEARKHQLDMVLSKMSGPERFEAVPQEGGSGLQKISRILRIDLGCEPTLSFDFDSDNQFVALIKFNPKKLIA